MRTVAGLALVMFALAMESAWADSSVPLAEKNGSAAAGMRTSTLQNSAALGLRLPDAEPTVASPFGARDVSDAMHDWRSRQRPEENFYGGVREVSHLGLRATESYGGLFQPLSGRWGSSLEASVTHEPLLALQRYSLTGQIHTAFSSGQGLSLGLKYSAYDPAAAWAGGSNLSTANNYALAPGYTAGGTGYRLQLNYLYGERNTVGFAYRTGRENEYFMLPSDALTDARQLSVTGRHWLSTNWALNYDVYAPESSNPLLHRQNLRLGLRYRF